MRLIRLASDTDFDGWRRAARILRLEGVPPAEVKWTVGEGEGAMFFDTRGAARSPTRGVAEDVRFTAPARFVSLAETVFEHGSPERFSLLYRLLWRLADNPRLLDDLDDADVIRARALAREVFAGRNRTADQGIAEAMKPPAPDSPAISHRAARAAERNTRDGAWGCDAPTSVEEVAAGVQACRRCGLWRCASRGVSGEGPARAALMLVGEQPGDREDQVGRPFVGPAGAVLDRAMAEAGVPRTKVFLTNAVRHFKHETRGKRRIHKTPSAGEVEACRWWLDAERRLVRPRVVLAMGATAALGVFGKATPVAANRGRVHPLPDGAVAMITYHPSFLLRVPDEAARAKAEAEFVADLRDAWGRAQGPGR